MLFYERCVEKRVTANDVCFEGKRYICSGWPLGTRGKKGGEKKFLIHPTRERRTRREINGTMLTSHRWQRTPEQKPVIAISPTKGRK